MIIRIQIAFFSLFRKIIFFFSILVSSFSMAQDFEGGMLFGITGSQIDGDNYGGYHHLGLNLGTYVRRGISEDGSFQMEIKYEGKGASAAYYYNPNAQVPPDPYRVGLHYIELPITYNHKIHPSFSFHIGLQPGYLFLQMFRDGYGDTYSIENFKKYEMAAVTGFYYHYTERIKVCLRFSYSLTPIFTTEEGNATAFWYRSSYNNSLGLCAFYRLGK